MSLLALFLLYLFGSLFNLECTLLPCYTCNCRKDRAEAVEILVKDLKVFSAFNEDLFKEITHLLTLDNFRYRTKSIAPVYLICRTSVL